MKLPLRLKRNDVSDFLKKVKEILKSDGTDSFVFIKNRKSERLDLKFTNSYCMEQLEYDAKDVMNEILTLEVSHYFETLGDRKSSDSELELLHVFIKEIQKRQVYIKIKIKEMGENEVVLCISFHFAEHKINKLPYN